MLKSILVGVALIGVTVAVHAVGSTYWLHFVAGRFSRSEQEQKWRPRMALSPLIGTAIALLLLHVVEVVLWALTYLALPRITHLETLEEAVYFSVVTFTTLGYGDLTLDKGWRLLSGIEAMNGILLFGLTTAILFSVVQKVDLALKKKRGSI